jgi:hypothetical protein
MQEPNKLEEWDSMLFHWEDESVRNPPPKTEEPLIPHTFSIHTGIGMCGGFTLRMEPVAVYELVPFNFSNKPVLWRT